MNLKSKYFDPIRISQPRNVQTISQPPICSWPDCTADAHYPALAVPAQNSREKQYFCWQHIQEYNHSYNFFENMSEEDSQYFHQEAATGHRPTWGLGARRAFMGEFQDPLEIMEQMGINEAPRPAKMPRISRGQKHALERLNLDETASKADVRKSYKELLKRFHPDMNGGDRSYEDMMQKTIQAYQYLRASGFC